MLWREKLSTQDIRQVRLAALNLFGNEQTLAPDFWQTLNLKKVKSAFRQKARLLHPDLYAQARPTLIREKHEHFIIIKDSYEVMKRFLGAGVFKHFG